MRLSSLKINSKVVEEGRWVDDIPGFPGLRLRMRGLENSDDRRVRAREIRALPKEAFDKDNNLLPEASDKVIATRLREALFLEWDGVTDDQDKPVKTPDPQRLAAMLADPDYRPLRDAMLTAAGMVSETKAKADEKSAKN